MYLIFINHIFKRWNQYFVDERRCCAAIIIVLDVDRIVPFSEAVIQSHNKSLSSNAARQIANEISYRPNIHAEEEGMSIEESQCVVNLFYLFQFQCYKKQLYQSNVCNNFSFACLRTWEVAPAFVMLRRQDDVLGLRSLIRRTIKVVLCLHLAPARLNIAAQASGSYISALNIGAKSPYLKGIS